MDAELVAWARAAKARRRGGWPVLWLFSDAVRAPDVLAAAARLPPGLCGIVLRHGDAALALALARLCRRRRIALALGVPHRLPVHLRAGRHLKAGARPAGRRATNAPLTAAAHGPAELRRARRWGAGPVFLSPAFLTASHPGQPALGPWLWHRWAGPAGAGA